MDKPKGGRGHTAPYSTKQMRVPVGLEVQIQELVDRYRKWISDNAAGIFGVDNPPLLLDKALDKFPGETEDKLVDNLKESLEKTDRLREELDTECTKLHSKNGDLNLEVAELRSQLADQARLAGERYDRVKAAEAELEQLRAQPVVPMVVDPEVIDLLRGALNLKANAGGAIKRKIEQALVLLTGADSQ